MTDRRSARVGLQGLGAGSSVGRWLPEEGDGSEPAGRARDKLVAMNDALRIIMCCLMLAGLVPSRGAAAGCELGQVAGGVDIAVSSVTGAVIVVAQGLRIFRSTDGGSSYSDAWIGVEGSWPSVAFRGQELFVVAGRWGDPNEVFLLHSGDGGASFSDPRTVYSSMQNLLIDPELLVLQDGSLMVFATEMFSQSGDGLTFTIHVFRSGDDGWSWQQLPDAVVGPAFPPAIEDAKAVELPNGELLLAYEREMVDLGESWLEEIRSRDDGLTWEQPTVLWQDVPGADNEPGGYLELGPDELWFLASTDEDSVETYANAVVKRKVSTDGGSSWHDKATLVDDPDQIVYGGAVTPPGMIVMATVRHFSTPPRLLFVYHADPQAPGIWACAPPVFIDGFEDGSGGRWSAAVP